MSNNPDTRARNAVTRFCIAAALALSICSPAVAKVTVSKPHSSGAKTIGKYHHCRPQDEASDKLIADGFIIINSNYESDRETWSDGDHYIYVINVPEYMCILSMH